MKFGIKQIWNLLFVLSFAVLLWVTASFTTKWIMFQRFSEVAYGSVDHIGVISLGEDKYHICTDYTFAFGDTTFCANYLYNDMCFSTEEAALEAISLMKDKKIPVWVWDVSGSTPISTLERGFPRKEGFRCLVTLLILFYFFLLKKYIYRFQSEPRQKPNANLNNASS